MSVLICKNIDIEGPETIENFLSENNIPYDIVELCQNNSIQQNTNKYNYLVLLGGPMSVNEDNIYTYLREEQELIKDFISKNKKIFGICLGAQLIAKSLNANVYKGKQPEIGWYDIKLTDEGKKDKLIQSLAKERGSGQVLDKFKVFQLHGETFDIPQNCVRLLESNLYPNQAFKYGNNVYAFQFHIEVKKETIFKWLKNENCNLNEIEKETEVFYNDYKKRAYSFYKLFFQESK